MEAKLGLDKKGDKVSKVLSQSFDKPHLLSKFIIDKEALYPKQEL